MKKTIIAVAGLLATSAALAAPRIESVTVTPSQAQFAGGKPPEVEVGISITRGKFDTGGCDARVDFGDGEGRNLDFSVAAKRTVRHAYKRDGSYTVVAHGTGAKPCEGSQQAPLRVAGAPAARTKVETKKSAATKTATAKKATGKKAAPKKKAPAKKKDEKEAAK
jgi:hypothetical protein